MREQIRLHVKSAQINTKEQCFCIDELNQSLCEAVLKAGFFPCFVYAVLKKELGEIDGIIVGTSLTPVSVGAYVKNLLGSNFIWIGQQAKNVKLLFESCQLTNWNLLTKFEYVSHMTLDFITETNSASVLKTMQALSEEESKILLTLPPPKGGGEKL